MVDRTSAEGKTHEYSMRFYDYTNQGNVTLMQINRHFDPYSRLREFNIQLEGNNLRVDHTVEADAWSVSLPYMLSRQ